MTTDKTSGEWLPIESAPKPDAGGLSEAFIVAQMIWPGVWTMLIVKNREGGLVVEWSYAKVRDSQMQPTHWMPLPSPPLSNKDNTDATE